METEIDGMKIIVQTKKVLTSEQTYQAAIRQLLNDLGRDTASGTLEVAERWLNPKRRR